MDNIKDFREFVSKMNDSKFKGKKRVFGQSSPWVAALISLIITLLVGGLYFYVELPALNFMNEELYIKPALSKRKIFIVKNADNMNNDAQNALLKSFEEPPAYAVIILLSENVKMLLPTIRSRGNKVVFEPFSEDVIRDYILRQYPLKRDSVDFIALYSGGVIGRAIELCEDEEFFETRRKMFEAVASLTGERLSIFKVADMFGVKSPRQGFSNCNLYFDLFTSFMRDVLAMKTGGRIINTDMITLIELFCKKVTSSSVLSIIERTADVRSQLNVSMKYDLWIVNMLINCWEDIHGKGSRS
jgi:DNA polymerase-3 subunit delta'